MNSQFEHFLSNGPKQKETKPTEQSISKLDKLMKNVRLSEECAKNTEASRIRYSINESDKNKIRSYILSSSFFDPKSNKKSTPKSNDSLECCSQREFFEEPNTKSNKLLISYLKKKSSEWKHFPNNLVDSHCHFDLLFPKIKYNHPNMYKYFSDYSFLYLKNFEACINIICHPKNFANKERLNFYFDRHSHPKIYHTIGCHPHFANHWRADLEETFIDALKSHPKIVALGECGLDQSKNNAVDLKQQIKVFERQLKIASQTQMPIVIHCRQAEEKCLEMLKQHLDPSHRIHLHCFTGNSEIALKYLNSFSNLCIGFTPLITFNLDAEKYYLKKMINDVPLDRILLETDSPYFVPQLKEFPSSDVTVSHPGFIFATAERLAELKNTCIEHVLDANRENVRKIYSF